MCDVIASGGGWRVTRHGRGAGRVTQKFVDFDRVELLPPLVEYHVGVDIQNHSPLGSRGLQGRLCAAALSRAPDPAKVEAAIEEAFAYVG